MKSRADCDCLCHSGGIVLHVVQCCDGIASLCRRKPIPVQRNLETHLPKNQIDSPPIGGPINCEGCSTLLHGGLSSFRAGGPTSNLPKMRLFGKYAFTSRPADPSTATISAWYRLRSSRPISCQIERALWSASISRSTSTGRNNSWERSIDARRGTGGDVFTLAV
jgi:hypothetical protein